jgi:hypothetical protein
MIAVIFEVWPKDGRTEEYLEMAASLRPLLDTIQIESLERLFLLWFASIRCKATLVKLY